jgi:hypothetical protein
VKIKGSCVLPATPQQVWELLTDPARLARCLPGCEKLEPTGPDQYKVAIKFVLAAFSGAYSGAVALSEKRPPESMRMKVEGKGAPGFMKGEGRLTLRLKGPQTEVSYEGEAQVGGVIAAVGQRMIEAAAKKIITQFFESAEKQLRAR